MWLVASILDNTDQVLKVHIKNESPNSRVSWLWSGFKGWGLTAKGNKGTF